MKTDFIEMSWMLGTSPRRVFGAWMSSEGHTAMTGGAAEVDPVVGGAFSAWDGYIEGETWEIVSGKRVMQSWRTLDFGRAPDSVIEVEFRPLRRKTQLILRHWDLQPGDGAKYTLGWQQFYLEPMRTHFGE
jgi:uncharacterized protein YndB with AHSA1/START domain